MVRIGKTKILKAERNFRNIFYSLRSGPSGPSATPDLLGSLCFRVSDEKMTTPKKRDEKCHAKIDGEKSKPNERINV